MLVCPPTGDYMIVSTVIIVFNLLLAFPRYQKHVISTKESKHIPKLVHQNHKLVRSNKFEVCLTLNRSFFDTIAPSFRLLDAKILVPLLCINLLASFG